MLTVDGKRANLGAEKIKAQILRAQTISVAFSDPHFDPIKVTLEIYREVEPGKWLSSNEKNTTLRAIYDDVFAKPQHVKAVDILGAPTLEARAEEAPIDAVYTWVNHDDPEWKANFQKWVNPTEPSDSVDDAGDANALSRFHNNDELRFSLRSIETNLPWLRHIYIFSNCAPPDWISTDHPRLSWVRHEQVMPADILPTFSSHVIESYLHRIPGLADKFIYLNDDFLVMRPMKKSDFFTESGMSLSRLEGYGMVSGPVRETDPDYLNAARNSAALVQQKFGFSPTRLHQHVPYALSRPVLEEIETSFQARIDAFRKNRFRKSNDLNIPSFLYHHYAIGSQRALLASAASIMVKSNDMLWERRLEQAQDRKYVFVCVNEGGADDAPSGWHAAIRQFLQRKFPQTAEWENPRP